MKKLRFLNVALIFVIWLSLVGFATPGNSSVTSAIVLAAPGSFDKVSPTNGAASQPALGVTLTWTASAGASGYQYCISPRPKCLGNNKKWQTAGTGTSVTTGALSANTVYYWQVRAIDASNNTTEANNGAWWRFKTQPGLGAFGKISPANGAIDQPVTSLDLKWVASANATGYEYCFYTGITNPCGNLNWTKVGNITSITVYNLVPNADYRWQVRAVNGSSTPQMADTGTYWQFHTVMSMPGSFDKLGPQDQATDQPVNLHLTWSPSTGADSYEYCIASTPACTSSGWTTVPSGTDVVPFPTLNYGKTYYWQVRAHNAQGNSYANADTTTDGAWWSFKTIAQPSAFTKIQPGNGDLHQSLSPYLFWSESANADHYEICTTTSASGCGPADAGWTPLGLETSYHMTGLARATTYYWQVRAVNGSVTVYAIGDLWSFTTLAAPPTSRNQPFTTNEDTQLNGQLTGTATSSDGIKFELYGLKPAGILSLAANGSFSYLPPANFNGTMTFKFTVTDGYNAPSAPYTATINVTPVNDPPVLTSLPDVQVLSGDDASFAITATDPDLPYGDTLTFLQPTGLPADATFDAASGTFIWTPLWSNTQSNDYPITFKVKDVAGLTDQITVHVTVTPMTIMLPFAMNMR